MFLINYCLLFWTAHAQTISRFPHQSINQSINQSNLFQVDHKNTESSIGTTNKRFVFGTGLWRHHVDTTITGKSITGNLITMLRLLKCNIVNCRPSHFWLKENVRATFDILDTRLLDAMFDVKTDWKKWCQTQVFEGAQEKKIPFEPEHRN